MWEELQRVIRKSKARDLRTSTDADLDAFEAARGFKLPTSYREFAKTFGRCALISSQEEFSAEFSFPAPGYNDQAIGDLLYFHNDSYRLTGSDAYFDNPEVGKRLTFFARDNDYNYGWDSSEVTDPVAHEYAIYVRGDNSYERAASSFKEFVTEYCFGDHLEDWRRWVAEGGEAMIDQDDDYDEDEDRRIILQPML